MADVVTIGQHIAVPSPNTATQRLGTDVLSTRLTADGVAYAGPCYLVGFTITGNGTDNGSALLYDNASAASGTIVGEGRCSSTTAFGLALPKPGRWCQNGIYVDLTTCTVIVYYQP